MSRHIPRVPPRSWAHSLTHPPLRPPQSATLLLFLYPRPLQRTGSTPFSTQNSILLKSKHKSPSSSAIASQLSHTDPASPSSPSSADPLNFTDYEAQIAKTHEHLRDQLARIKAGGHDVDAIEAIRVRVKAAEDRSHQGKKGSGSNSKQHEALPTVGELASVIVRGRNVVVMVGEKENLKPVLSALQNTPNLNPQHMSQSPNGAAAGSTTDTAQHINIPVPPTTTDSRTTAAKLAHEKGETAHFALREARGAQKKKLRAMQLAKRVGPDALRRAEKEMEKINEAAGGVVKRLVEEARRRLERN